MVTEEQKLENWNHNFDERIEVYSQFMQEEDFIEFAKFGPFSTIDRNSFEYKRMKRRALHMASLYVEYNGELYCKLTNEMGFIPFTEEELKTPWWKKD